MNTDYWNSDEHFHLSFIYSLRPLSLYKPRLIQKQSKEYWLTICFPSNPVVMKVKKNPKNSAVSSTKAAACIIMIIYITEVGRCGIKIFKHDSVDGNITNSACKAAYSGARFVLFFDVRRKSRILLLDTGLTPLNSFNWWMM